MSVGAEHRDRRLRRRVLRLLLASLLIAGILLGVLIALDQFGTQPQPFQYLLH